MAVAHRAAQGRDDCSLRAKLLETSTGAPRTEMSELEPQHGWFLRTGATLGVNRKRLPFTAIIG